ncbi:hypothetical protein GGTG_08502 [Gaeumannomyces tritici R3-111a-1]|uniref:Uncharacterized protein n=1 Tax=Gaeumannomyces tritici (strain R3-111a-1) TaxID=644352 RepID=J3P4R5_GAET3|nr:hypothetical protein GGTG_08502 [Gaeumannomyces tritici R3-111a-1]EJT74662.1 hypothetical protein GGTG_08502 [Gaeumannomyces tritici R3-111a-1]
MPRMDGGHSLTVDETQLDGIGGDRSTSSTSASRADIHLLNGSRTPFAPPSLPLRSARTTYAQSGSSPSSVVGSHISTKDTPRCTIPLHPLFPEKGGKEVGTLDYPADQRERERERGKSRLHETHTAVPCFPWPALSHAWEWRWEMGIAEAWGAIGQGRDKGLGNIVNPTYDWRGEQITTAQSAIMSVWFSGSPRASPNQPGPLQPSLTLFLCPHHVPR